MSLKSQLEISFSNRTSGTVNGTPFTATYDDQDRMLTFNSFTFDYSDNGDLIEKTDGTNSQVLAWDEMSRLKSVVLNGTDTLEYRLDWNGRRVERKLNAARTNGFAYDGPYTLAVDKNNLTGSIVDYVTATTPNSVDFIKVGLIYYRVIKDHLGSPRLVVHFKTAAVAQRMDYNEWGAVTNDTNPGFQKFGFAGGLYDQHTKLVKFGAREYDGSIGRWLSKDPIRFDGGDSNLYGYVLQDPINAVDISGNIVIPLPVLIVAGAGAANAVGSAVGTYLSGGTSSEILSSAASGVVSGAVTGLSALGGLYFGIPTSAAAVLTGVLTNAGTALVDANDILGSDLAKGHKDYFKKACR